MVDRRRLTPAVVAGLAPPARGERWVADTELRGFGVRLWAAREGPGLAYAIRVTDREGRKIRRSFSASPGFLEAQREIGDRARIWATLREGGVEAAAIPFPPPLPLLLDPARAWAREEIQRAKLGESDADRTRRLLAAEAARLGALTLDEAVEEFCETSRFLSRTEAYRDRLEAAYHNNLPADLRGQTLLALNDGDFDRAFEALPISEPQRRLVRGLLGPVIEGVRANGGPWLPFWRRATLSTEVQREARANKARDSLKALQRSDFERLLEALRSSAFGWRAGLCLETCLLTHVPVFRVMRGRWSQVSGDIWYPWGPEDRDNWRFRWERLDGDLGRCMERVRVAAAEEGVISDCWFPSFADASRPVANIDRPWRAALSAAGWPPVTLKSARAALAEEFLMERLKDLADVLEFSRLAKRP